MNRPKIAIVTLHPSNGGGILSSLRVVYDFCQRYFEPTVFCLSFDPALSAHLRPLSFSSAVRYSRIEGMPCVEIGARWAFWEPGHYVNTLSDWRRELSAFDYFFVTSGTAIAAHPLTLLKKKFVLWVAAPHRDDRVARVATLPLIRRCIERLSLPRMLAIEQQILKSASRLLPLSSCAVEGVTQHICPYPIEPALLLRNRKKAQQVIAIGRFDDPRKNVAMLLRTWRIVYAQYAAARLVVIGRRPPEIVLQPYADLMASGSILFTGVIAAEERDRLLSESMVLLITSYQEGLGIIGLEALAHAVPVIATRCGGPSDYVVEGKTGFLVAINDDQYMAALTMHLLQQPHVAQAMGDAGVALVKERFSTAYVHRLFKQHMIAAWPELADILS